METYFVGNQPEPEDRTKILISLADSEKIEALPKGPSAAVATVYDNNTEQMVSVRRADCGLSCYCALEFVNA